MSYIVPSVCGLVLLVGGIIAINPFISNNITYALMDNGNDSDTDGSSSNTTTSSSIALSITNDGNVNPDGSTTAEPGKITYNSYRFTVEGHVSQYAVTLNAANGYTGELRGRSNPNTVINKVMPETKFDDFSFNTWGYAVTTLGQVDTNPDGLSYEPVPEPQPAIPAILASRYNLDSSASTSDEYKLVFATKMGYDLPSDHYGTKLYLSAVSDSEATALIGFKGASRTIATMQEMTDQFCNTVNSGTKGRLRDVRDGKYYWVAKLADGNCWMTQNLDLNIPAILRADTSDVALDTVTNTTQLTSISSWSGSSATSNIYYDPGEYVYSSPNFGPVSGNPCNNVTSFADSKCPSYFKEATKSSDMHYAVGNYYSYAAATVKSVDGIASGEAPYSICPKGWRLPTGNSGGNFESLVSAYGWTASNPSSSSMNNNGGIYGAPLYFVFGGYIHDRDNLIMAADGGRYWSASPESVSRAYVLNFSGSVNPSYTYTSSGGNHRLYGASVRCIHNPAV